MDNLRDLLNLNRPLQMSPRYDVPRDFDLLTIDTDYNDYWTATP